MDILKINPAAALAWVLKHSGWTHSEMNWLVLRQQFDYANELVDVPTPARFRCANCHTTESETLPCKCSWCDSTDFEES